MWSRVWGWPTICWCLPVLVVLCLAGEVRAQAVTLQVTPDVVEINSFYNGHNVTVTGTVPGVSIPAVASVRVTNSFTAGANIALTNRSGGGSTTIAAIRPIATIGIIIGKMIW